MSGRRKAPRLAGYIAETGARRDLQGGQMFANDTKAQGAASEALAAAQH
jgi:hypothetical protein